MTADDFAEKAQSYPGVTIVRLRAEDEVVLLIKRRHGDRDRLAMMLASPTRLPALTILAYCRDLDLPPGDFGLDTHDF